MIGRLKFDISGLVAEMLDQLPDEVWTSDTTTFLDPCMGGGQFVAEIERRLRIHGHSDENIASRVHGFENNLMRVNYAINKHKLVGDYQAINFLEANMQKKFDVIVGNPPYQDSRNKLFYQDFVIKSFNLGTTVAMITPSGWVSHSGKNNIFYSKVLENGLICYRFLGDKVFDAQIITVYFICERNTKKDNVLVNGQLVRRSDLDILPSNDIKIVSILNKVSEKAKLSPLVFGIGNLYRKDTVLDKNGIKCIASAGKKNDDYDWNTVSKKHLINGDVLGYGSHKVIFSGFTSIGKLGAIKYAGPDYACGAQCIFTEVKNQNEAENLIQFLESKIVKACIKELKSAVCSNSRNMLKLIPKIDLTRNWTDQELYAYFGLTQDEIDYIENAVK